MLNSRDQTKDMNEYVFKLGKRVDELQSQVEKIPPPAPVNLPP